MSVEERLRALLNEHAASVTPAPDWDDLAARVRRAQARRTRRRAAAVGLVLIVGPAVGLVVATSAQGNSPSVVASGDPGTPGGKSAAGAPREEATGPDTDPTFPQRRIPAGELPPDVQAELDEIDELPERDGPPPADEEVARQDVIAAYQAVYAVDAADEGAIDANVDDPRGIADASARAADAFPTVFESLSVRVDEVRFLNPTTAAVRYTLLTPDYDVTELPNLIGRAVLDDGDWKVTRDTICEDIALTGESCG